MKTTASDERPCGITVREDRVIGAEGESGETVVRRGEVLSIRVGSAPLTELPWVEGIAGILLALVTAFLIGVRLDGGERTYNGSGTSAAALTGSAAASLLTRTLYRRRALIVALRSGDRRRLWMPGTEADGARLVAALKKHRWPLVS